MLFFIGQVRNHLLSLGSPIPDRLGDGKNHGIILILSNIFVTILQLHSIGVSSTIHTSAKPSTEYALHSTEKLQHFRGVFLRAIALRWQFFREKGGGSRVVCNFYSDKGTKASLGL